jgi:sulfate transport system ATP-binding protein
LPSSPWSASPSSNGDTATGSPPPAGTNRSTEAVGITAEALGKSFGSTVAVDALDLAVTPGELLALLGPSGSGKTTLLRLVAGLETPTSGRILFGGEDATHLPVRERRVGFVFQHYALFKHLNVAENVAYGLRVRPRATRPSDREIRRRVGELLELVQLGALGRRAPAQLSGGQRQRVALARALAVEPRVLLLDEPFGALDAQVRRDLRRWLRELHDHTGHTTLFVTHDQEEALELADRVAILNKGRIEQIGTPDELLDRPATVFVAGFVGEAVRLPVELGDSTVRIGSQVIALTHGLPAGSGALFVRPHDFVLADPVHTDQLDATVISMRRRGSVRRLELAFDNGLPTVEIEIPLESSAARKGERIALRLVTPRLFAS